VKNDSRMVSGLGEILVCAYRTRSEIDTEWTAASRPLKDAPTEIAEKALKGQALSHGIRFVPHSV
jgi:hypothetical protein